MSAARNASSSSAPGASASSEVPGRAYAAAGNHARRQPQPGRGGDAVVANAVSTAPLASSAMPPAIRLTSRPMRIW